MKCSLLLRLTFLLFLMTGDATAKKQFRTRRDAVINATDVVTSQHRQDLAANPRYYMPGEDEPHEGTWFQWPHDYGWDPRHVARYEKIWIDMTRALHVGERVHIIVYNYRHLRRVRSLLKNKGLDMKKIDFWDYPTDDVWIRDNGPIFAYNEQDKLIVEDWKFNGWGGKAEWWFDDYIPIDVARDLGLPRVNVNMVNEGGSVEIDGHGTMMAKKSSILNPNRNPGMTQAQAEAYFRKYLGVDRFIWLEGQIGLDITDDHIDGTARFAGPNKIVTMRREDLFNPEEYDVLKQARNAYGQPYELIHLPVTTKDIGEFKGVYVNYYVGNEVVIVPIFGDANDSEALRIMGTIYPVHRIHGIRMDELWVDGGGAHCVTQQQPVAIRRRN